MLFEEHAVLYGVCKATGHVAGQALESLMAYQGADMLEGSMFMRPITCQRIDNETHTYWEIWAPIAQ